MILSLSAKDLESLFYGVLENFYGNSLAVRHNPLEKPENRTSNEKPPKSCATSEQPQKDTKYLQLLNNSYYFVWKYRKKVIKYNLKVSNLYKAQIFCNTILLNLQNIRRVEADESNITSASSLTVREGLRFIKQKIRDINMNFLEEVQNSDIDYNDIWTRNYDEDLDEIMNLYRGLDDRQKLKLKERMEYLDSFSVPNLDDDGEIIYKQPKNYQAPQSIEEQEKMLTLRQGFDEWFNYKKNVYKVGDSSLKTYQSGFKYLTLFVGEDKKIDTFTTKDFKIIRRYLLELPANTFKFLAFKDKTIKEVLEINEILENQTLNNKTINNHCMNYKAMFDFFIYEEHIDKNPVQFLKKLDEKKSNRTSFDDSDIVQIFSEIKEQELKDMMKISLYTGMRISEILLLEKSDIQNDVLLIRQGKTDSAKRKIYIHDEIKAIVKFYLDNNETPYLIFDGNVNRIGKTINRRIKEVLKDDAKTFHSFRKRFTKELLKIENRQLEYIQKILGHSIAETSKLTTETYGEEFEVSYKYLKSYIEFIKYDFEGI